jgi:hypothetical protein
MGSRVVKFDAGESLGETQRTMPVHEWNGEFSPTKSGVGCKWRWESLPDGYEASRDRRQAFECT